MSTTRLNLDGFFRIKQEMILFLPDLKPAAREELCNDYNKCYGYSDDEAAFFQRGKSIIISVDEFLDSSKKNLKISSERDAVKLGCKSGEALFEYDTVRGKYVHINANRESCGKIRSSFKAENYIELTNYGMAFHENDLWALKLKQEKKLSVVLIPASQKPNIQVNEVKITQAYHTPNPTHEHPISSSKQTTQQSSQTLPSGGVKRKTEDGEAETAKISTSDSKANNKQRPKKQKTQPQQLNSAVPSTLPNKIVLKTGEFVSANSFALVEGLSTAINLPDTKKAAEYKKAVIEFLAHIYAKKNEISSKPLSDKTKAALKAVEDFVFENAKQHDPKIPLENKSRFFKSSGQIKKGIVKLAMASIEKVDNDEGIYYVKDPFKFGK